jgi:hypothetical protein
VFSLGTNSDYFPTQFYVTALHNANALGLMRGESDSLNKIHITLTLL